MNKIFDCPQFSRTEINDKDNPQKKKEINGSLNKKQDLNMEIHQKLLKPAHNQRICVVWQNITKQTRQSALFYLIL